MLASVVEPGLTC